MTLPPALPIRAAILPLLLAFAATPFVGVASAHETGAAHVHFQRPNKGSEKSSSSQSNLQFRSNRAASAETTPGGDIGLDQKASLAPVTTARPRTSNPKVQAVASTPEAESKRAPAKPAATTAAKQGVVKQGAAKQISTQHNKAEARPAYLDGLTDGDGVDGLPAQESTAMRPSRSRTTASQLKKSRATHAAFVADAQDDLNFGTKTQGTIQQTGYLIRQCEPACAVYEPGCAIGDPACGLAEPACGLVEPGCAAPGPCDCGEPACGICEPGCGLVTPGCGLADPSCGCVEGCGEGVGCGSCVDAGSDYWCFPVCLPRFKDLSIWGGVHAFKGPRDSLLFGGPADGNFGFQEGISLGGRAPFIGLIFPELSYQLGYQAVQSRLAGTSGPTLLGTSNERTQHFLTGGFFRRVKSGVQGGVVWDMMRDDLVSSQDFHQVRYEVSLKSPLGRELGFMGANHVSTQVVGGINYQTVDQYVLFFRCHFKNGSEGRLWGGATDDGEGLFGGDFYAPLNNRWSLQTGFNYLIPDQNGGPIAAREESWNLGMNLVWHFGRAAKQAQCSPHRPLFQLADNGSMFIDQAP